MQMWLKDGGSIIKDYATLYIRVRLTKVRCLMRHKAFVVVSSAESMVLNSESLPRRVQ